MPELPDLVVYVEHLAARIRGARLERVRLASPFLLRTVTPALAETEGKTVQGVLRFGKRIVLSLEADLFLVFHLMIAGRLHWRQAQAAVPKKTGLAAFDFPSGTVLLTEAGAKRRASLHVVRSDGLAALDRGGLEVLEADLVSFGGTLRRENHTLKRALTDPTLFSGIGNAYSDEILNRARLSPLALTGGLTDEQVEVLYRAARATLSDWVERLRREAGDEFPEKVTAFREGMAVHGRYGKPCPVCGSPVQRIVYASNEANYCARCQTGGRLLADRALSRLLKKDWPHTIEELEERRSSLRRS
jgi:formamidopyrimidine-DNA glycosylase